MPRFIYGFVVLGTLGALGYARAPGGDMASGASNGPVRLTAATTRAAVVERRAEKTVLRIAVKGAPRPDDGNRVPIDLALVLDRSGSMAGEKMADLRRAALEAIDRLRPGDRVAVITFDDDAEAVGWTGISADGPAGLNGLRERIGGMYARGSTNMVAGLELARLTFEGQPASGRVRRVLLVSDGHPDETEGIVPLARTLARMSVVVSALGLGRDYNEDLLAAMADAGLGAYYFVDAGQPLEEVFAGEVEAATQVVARDARLHIRFADGVALERVHGFDNTSTFDNAVYIWVGDVYAGRTINVLTSIALPPSEGWAAAVADVQLTFSSLDGSPAPSLSEKVAVRLTRDAVAAEASTVAPVMEKVEKLYAAQAYVDANRAFNRGDAAEGNRILTAQKERLELQSEALGLDALVEEARALERIQAANGHQDRKAMNNAMKWRARLLTRGE